MVGLSAVGSHTGHSPEDGADGGDGRSGTSEPGCSCREASDAPLARPHFFSALLEGIGLTPEEDWRWLRRYLEASIKGFSIGAGLKGGLALFSILARLRSRGSKGYSTRKAVSITNGEVVVSAAKETLKYGIFLGAYAGTFVAADELIAAIWGQKRTAGWRALLAGAVAGPSMLLTGLETQHTSLAIYILMRAAVLVSRCGIKSKRFRNVCKPLTWSHGDIFLMCLSSSQILSAYILKQESLLPSYKAFLNRHGGKPAVILQRVKEIATGTPFTNLDEVEKHYKYMGVDLKLDPSMKVPCSVRFDAIGEHTGNDHDRNIMVPFGGKPPGSEGPGRDRLPTMPFGGKTIGFTGFGRRSDRKGESYLRSSELPLFPPIGQGRGVGGAKLTATGGGGQSRTPAKGRRGSKRVPVLASDQNFITSGPTGANVGEGRSRRGRIGGAFDKGVGYLHSTRAPVSASAQNVVSSDPTGRGRRRRREVESATKEAGRRWRERRCTQTAGELPLFFRSNRRNFRIDWKGKSSEGVKPGSDWERKRRTKGRENEGCANVPPPLSFLPSIANDVRTWEEWRHRAKNGCDVRFGQIIHGNQTCTGHFFSFLIQAYGRALPVYAPVYLIPALIVHRQDLVKRPYTILAKSLIGTTRSSLFLSTYCASACSSHRGWTCLLFRIFERCNIAMVAMGMFPTGLALAIEKKSRRMEISLYCLSRAIESFFTCASDAGFLTRPSRLKHADVVLFSLATAIIMHCYAQDREVFRSKYVNVLDWLFGLPPSCQDEPDKDKTQ
ncbi:hypothetical protein M5K25_012569 [Dendrobium thyrsiflorum]|uniref:Transmembrane protein 135 N-terminal domain-containing protein n=1 Tax=Dendrobium thyrsiflorum TaxID=117978 RepID=A0ABD0UXV2_DENTH